MKIQKTPLIKEIIFLPQRGYSHLVKNGEVLDAEIIEASENGTLTLATKKGKLQATTTTTTLKKGALVRLRAEVSRGRLTLRVIDYTSLDELLLEKKIRSLLQSLKPEGASLTQLVSVSKEGSVKALLPESIKLESIIKSIETLIENPEDIKETIRQSGILLESHLKHNLKDLIDQDLKANLLKIKSHLEDMAKEKALPEALKSLKESTERLLQTIEYFQFKSKLNDALQLFLPYVWRELEDGSLEFRRQRGSPKKLLYHCIIKLNLINHGKLLVIVTQEAEGIHISMFSEKTKLGELLQKQSGLLKKRLIESGIRLKNLTIEQQKRLELVERSLEKGLTIRA